MFWDKIIVSVQGSRRKLGMRGSQEINGSQTSDSGKDKEAL